MPKMLFLFNQLLSDTSLAGGEVRALKMLDYFSGDASYEVEVMAPEVSKKLFEGKSALWVGKNPVEELLNQNNTELGPAHIFILYVLRTLESLKYLTHRNVRIIYATGDFFCDTVFAYLYQLLNPKVIWVNSVHHLNQDPFNRKASRWLNNLASFLSQRVSFALLRRRGNLVIVTNTLVRDGLIKLGFPALKIVVAGNGLEIQEIRQFCEQYADQKPEPKLTYFGRVNKTKGVYDLPAIFSHILKIYPNYTLDIIGSVTERIKCDLRAEFHKRGNLEKVTFHGFVEKKEDAYKILLNSSLVLFPTYEEGWCLSLFEVIICQRPTVAYRLPVFQELFEGKLQTAEVGNTYKFAQTALALLDPEKAAETQTYVTACYKIASRYEWRNVFDLEKRSIESLV